MLDTPSNNFPTWNSTLYSVLRTYTSEGNLKAGWLTSGGANCAVTITPPSTGKWYWEQTCTIAGGSWPYLGTVDSTVYEVVGTWIDSTGKPGEAESNGGWKIGALGAYETDGGGETAGGHVYVAGDIVQFALDHDNGALYYGVNNVWYTPSASTGDPTSGGSRTGAVMTWTAGARDFLAAVQTYDTSTSVINFGQDSSFAGAKTAQGNQDGNDIGDFYYTPPTGYLAVCISNLPDPSIALPGDNFNTVLYTGNGSTQSITGVGFQPDVVWIKDRTTAESHMLYDAVRGAEETIMPNQTSAEFNTGDRLSAFGSDGFSVGDNDAVNKNTDAIVSWNWKAGGASTVTNNDGSIESEVSANTTAGFSLFTYTGTGAAGTVGHGLSSNPDMIIFKGTNVVSDWPVYYERADTGTLAFPLLDTTAAHIVSGFTWDSTKFTFSSASGYSNTSGTNYMAYAFRSVEGYSKVGTYTGNGTTDNAFTYTGFRPAWLLVKKTSASGTQWYLWDDKRNTYNEMLDTLSPDTNSAESLNNIEMDFVSNGFKVRSGGSAAGANAQTFLYMAFAESPFKTANAR